MVCKDVEQHVVVLEEDQKFLKLLELLGIYQQQGGVIVFVDKQESADELLKDLMKASYHCMSLHGGIDQFDRDSTIVDFKSGKVKLLVSHFYGSLLCMFLIFISFVLCEIIIFVCVLRLQLLFVLVGWM